MNAATPEGWLCCWTLSTANIQAQRPNLNGGITMSISTNRSVRLSFPVVSYRKLDTPFSDRKWGFAVVDVSKLPDLKDWREINVRDPKLTGDVPKAIAESFSGDMD